MNWLSRLGLGGGWKRWAVAAALVVVVGLQVAGSCSPHPAPFTPSQATVRQSAPTHITPDTSACKLGRLSEWQRCVDKARADAQTAEAAPKPGPLDDAIKAADALAAAEADAIEAGKQDWRRQWGGGIGAFLVVVGLLSLTAKPEMGQIPPHRDPHGPAAGAARADADADRVAAWPAIAAGAGLLAHLFLSVPAPAAATPPVLALAAAVARFRHHKVTAAGYRIADQRWQEAAQAAEAGGRPWPAEPHLDAAAAHQLGASGGFTAPRGSAASVMFDALGTDAPTRAAWDVVAPAVGISWADVAAVTALENGDVRVVWTLHNAAKTSVSMAPAAAPLCRQLRVRGTGGFQADVATGQVFAVFTNTDPGAAAQPAHPTDPGWNF